MPTTATSGEVDGEPRKLTVKGPWTKEEDDVVIRLVGQYGPRRWSLIASNLPGRTGKQCRERWHNQLDPNINKEGWTEEEDYILAKAHQELGNHWVEISRRLAGRTDNSRKKLMPQNEVVAAAASAAAAPAAGGGGAGGAGVSWSARSKAPAAAAATSHLELPVPAGLRPTAPAEASRAPAAAAFASSLARRPPPATLSASSTKRRRLGDSQVESLGTVGQPVGRSSREEAAEAPPLPSDLLFASSELSCGTPTRGLNETALSTDATMLDPPASPWNLSSARKGRSLLSAGKPPRSPVVSTPTVESRRCEAKTLFPAAETPIGLLLTGSKADFSPSNFFLTTSPAPPPLSSLRPVSGSTLFGGGSPPGACNNGGGKDVRRPICFSPSESAPGSTQLPSLSPLLLHSAQKL